MTVETLAGDSTEVANDPAAIWTRLLNPFGETLTPEAARSILALKFGPADVDRMNLLAAKARAGELTRMEERESESYHVVGALLGIMWSKAREALRKTGLDPGAS